MRQTKKRESRRVKSEQKHRDTKSIRSAFIINMFREFPDRVFTLKHLVSASGGNSREGRYMVKDILEDLIAQEVVIAAGRDKYQLSFAQLPHYEGVVEILNSGAAYVKVEELEREIYVNPRAT
ncbi:MAG: ribonuclease R, partial [Alistipes sp.]|nr:ribonuclease R [Alistipes sp.]